VEPAEVFELHWEDHGDYLRAAISGATTVASMFALADAIGARCAAAGRDCVVLDCAGMTGAVPLVDLFNVAKYFAGHLPHVRLAAINAPAHWRDNRFSEDVISNRGGELRHFRDEAQARAWFRAARD